MLGQNVWARMHSSYQGEVEAQVLASFPYFCGCVSESYVFLP